MLSSLSKTFAKRTGGEIFGQSHFLKSQKIADCKRSIHHPFFQPLDRSNEPIRVGIIGAGDNTKKMHIPNLKKQQGIEITCVANRTIESAEKTAKEFNIPRAYRYWQEVLNDKQVDAVVIGTWPYMHKTISIAALEAGKHVLCEARMAMNARESHEMHEASKRRPHLVTQLVPSPYTLKYDKTIQKLISQRYLGDIIAINLKAINPSFVDKSQPLHWRQDITKSGYNTLQLGIWVEALYRWVGPASNVLARSQVLVKQRKNPETDSMEHVQIPEHVDIIAEMACGAQTNMQFSSVLGLSETKNKCSIFGTEGTIVLDLDKGVLLGGQKGAKELKPIEISPEDEGKWRVEEEFINSIRGLEKVKLTTFPQGVDYMEFTEAVWRSAKQQRAVSLPLDTV